MADGYVYCFSNPSMPGILNVGMTERTPEARLSEANASNTWGPPTPFKIEHAKKVSDASGKEKTLHTILEKKRIHPRHEFFGVSPEEVRKFFDLMDGEIWVETRVDEDEEEEEEEDTSSESAPQEKSHQKFIIKYAQTNLSPFVRVRSNELYEEYNHYCLDHNLPPISSSQAFWKVANYWWSNGFLTNRKRTSGGANWCADLNLDTVRVKYDIATTPEHD
jgi:hypothetical protein